MTAYSELEKPIRGWRVSWIEGSPGCSVYFDPREERLTLRDLTEAEKRARVDRMTSVSGLIGSDDFPDVSDGKGARGVLEPPPGLFESS